MAPDRRRSTNSTFTRKTHLRHFAFIQCHSNLLGSGILLLSILRVYFILFCKFYLKRKLKLWSKYVFSAHTLPLEWASRGGGTGKGIMFSFLLLLFSFLLIGLPMSRTLLSFTLTLFESRRASTRRWIELEQVRADFLPSDSFFCLIHCVIEQEVSEICSLGHLHHCSSGAKRVSCDILHLSRVSWLRPN